MALLWGLTYQAMGGGKSNAAVATALAQVLRERITATQNQQTREVSYSLRLAPGQMPARRDTEGKTHAPVAHVFEMLFGPAVTGFRPPWSIEQFHDALSNWLGLVATRGTPLDRAAPVDSWLVALARAGHLEAYCYELLGPAFPAEYRAFKATEARELAEYKAYLKGAPLVPDHAPLPDELVELQ
jgi:hypothetical protein